MVRTKPRADPNKYRLINEKKNQLMGLKQQRDQVLVDFEDSNKPKLDKNDLISNIVFKNLRIQLLKAQLSDLEITIKQNQDETHMLDKSIDRKEKRLRIYVEKIENCKNTLANKIRTVSKQRDDLARLDLEKYQLEKERISEFDRKIFELNKVNKGPFFKIMGFSLPTTGEYMSLYNGDKTDRCLVVYGLSFVLLYVNIISSVLALDLPFPIHPDEYLMTESQFQNTVAKLNTNIIYLNMSRNIPVEQLSPKQTVKNLANFLTHFLTETRQSNDHKKPISRNLGVLIEEMFTNEDNCDQDEWEMLPNRDDTSWDAVSETTSSLGCVIS